MYNHSLLIHVVTEGVDIVTVTILHACIDPVAAVAIVQTVVVVARVACIVCVFAVRWCFMKWSSIETLKRSIATTGVAELTVFSICGVLVTSTDVGIKRAQRSFQGVRCCRL
jgi:hypothetical protein